MSVRIDASIRLRRTGWEMTADVLHRSRWPRPHLASVFGKHRTGIERYLSTQAAPDDYFDGKPVLEIIERCTRAKLMPRSQAVLAHQATHAI